MYTLYIKPGCPYCQNVLGEAESLGISFNLKDIVTVPAYAEELIARGGKRQVPYLVDEEKGVEMYESNDIIAYISNTDRTVPAATFGGLKIHKSEDICDMCQ